MHIRTRTVTGFDAVPEEGRAVILYLTRLVNGVALALDLRQDIGAKLGTKRLLERGPRTEKNAIRLAEDLATITGTENVYIINCHEDPEKES